MPAGGSRSFPAAKGAKAADLTTTTLQPPDVPPPSPIGLTPRSHSSYNLWSTIWSGASVGAAVSAEETLIKKYLRSPFTLGRVAIECPTLGLGTQYINTLDVNADVRGGDGVPIVLTHGAGSGIGFFFKNFEALANLGGVRRRLVAFDWLGAAGSSRPSFPYGMLRAPTFTLTDEQKIDAAIAFSVDSLEAWRVAMRLERFDLLAHSMGGYLATQYAMRHPERVRRLVLISPVGWAKRPTGELESARASGFFGFLWNTGLANFGLAKTVGRVVRNAAQSAVVGRLGIANDEERHLVADYFWNSLCSQSLSAEQNVNWLLVPYLPPAPFGFYARRPVSTEAASRLAALPPTTLLYGSHDLHYIPTMPEAVRAVQAASPQPVKMEFVRGADHHLYVDQPREFHRLVKEALYG